MTVTEGRQKVCPSEGKQLSEAFLTVQEVQTHVLPSICGYSHWVRTQDVRTQDVRTGLKIDNAK